MATLQVALKYFRFPRLDTLGDEAGDGCQHVPGIHHSACSYPLLLVKAAVHPDMDGSNGSCCLDKHGAQRTVPAPHVMDVLFWFSPR